jgi:hypothetical protein
MTTAESHKSTVQLELKQLRLDSRAQPRVVIDNRVVNDYAQQICEGATFPPVVAFRNGDIWWLADGFHRYHASWQAGREKIDVDEREGTLRDAILYSLGANAEHGLRRSNADKRRAVAAMLCNKAIARDDEGTPWSDGAIAARCRVSSTFVTMMRSRLTSNVGSEGRGRRAYTTKHGTKAVMETSKIGRSSERRRTGPARISPDAFQPKPHSKESRVPMMTVSLPLNNPRQAARSMTGIFGDDYTQRLFAEFARIFMVRAGIVKPDPAEARGLPDGVVGSPTADAQQTENAAAESPLDFRGAAGVLVTVMGRDCARGLAAAVCTYLDECAGHQAPVENPESHAGEQGS